MKTIEEFLKEIEGSEELAKEFNDYSERNALDEFFKKHGCDFTEEDLNEFVIKEGAISDDEAEGVAGGIMARKNNSQECPKSPDGAHVWADYFAPKYVGYGTGCLGISPGRLQHKCVFCDLRVPLGSPAKPLIR